MNILEIYEYNQHFVAMMNVINAAKLNPPVKGHKHHIIPRCYFKMKNLEVDNSENNIVLLTYEDHCKVHKLAFLCAKDFIKAKLCCAYHRLTKGEVLDYSYMKGKNNPFYGKKHTEDTLIKLRKPKSEHHREMIKLTHADVSGKNNPMYGKPSANRGKHWKLVNGKRTYF